MGSNLIEGHATLFCIGDGDSQVCNRRACLGKKHGFDHSTGRRGRVPGPSSSFVCDTVFVHAASVPVSGMI